MSEPCWTSGNVTRICIQFGPSKQSNSCGNVPFNGMVHRLHSDDKRNAARRCSISRKPMLPDKSRYTHTLFTHCDYNFIVRFLPCILLALSCCVRPPPLPISSFIYMIFCLPTFCLINKPLLSDYIVHHTHRSPILCQCVRHRQPSAVQHARLAFYATARHTFNQFSDAKIKNRLCQPHRLG